MERIPGAEVSVTFSGEATGEDAALRVSMETLADAHMKNTLPEGVAAVITVRRDSETHAEITRDGEYPAAGT